MLRRYDAPCLGTAPILLRLSVAIGVALGVLLAGDADAPVTGHSAGPTYRLLVAPVQPIGCSLPPVLPNSVAGVAALLPPIAGGPYDGDGSFSFIDLNVYASGPVDMAIPNAPAVGLAAVIRFFADFQRTSSGSFPNLDWPILLGEQSISAAGSLSRTLPANLPLFEQPRSAGGTVPLTGNGAAHVAGMNAGRPGEVVRCVGCHLGHSMPPIPADPAFTILALGAAIGVTSSRDARYTGGLTDRRVVTTDAFRHWTSANGQTTGQAVMLTLPVPVTVRTVRLYGIPIGGDANSSISVGAVTVRLYDGVEVGRATAGPIATAGTIVAFADIRARGVQVTIDNVSGTFYGQRVAGLAEIEVIGRGEP